MQRIKILMKQKPSDGWMEGRTDGHALLARRFQSSKQARIENWNNFCAHKREEKSGNPFFVPFHWQSESESEMIFVYDRQELENKDDVFSQLIGGSILHKLSKFCFIRSIRAHTNDIIY